MLREKVKKVKKWEHLSIKIYIVGIFIATCGVFTKREVFTFNNYFYFIEKWSIFHFFLLYIYGTFKETVVKYRKGEIELKTNSILKKVIEEEEKNKQEENKTDEFRK